MFGFKITPCGRLGYRAIFCHPHTGFAYWPLAAMFAEQGR